jgi:peptidyl-prolyl cis-trans isomerase C
MNRDKKLFPPLTITFCLILTSIIFTNCQSKPGVVIARVGNVKFTKPELDVQLPEGMTVTQENLPLLLDKWVNSELLYQEAERQGMAKNDTIQIQAQQLAKEYIVNAYLKHEAAKIKVPSSDLLAYFNAHKDDFMSEVKIRRIVLSSPELAQTTLSELKNGSDFVKLARERSIEQIPDSLKGSTSQFFARGILPTDPSLEEAIFALKPGQLSDVLETSEGYQIIQLVEKHRVKKDVSFAEEADYIDQILSMQASRARIDSIINDLRIKGKFQTYPNAYFSAGKK